MKSEVGTAVRPEGCGEASGLYFEMETKRETERDTGRGGETDSRREKRGPRHLEAWAQAAKGLRQHPLSPNPSLIL